VSLPPSRSPSYLITNLSRSFSDHPPHRTSLLALADLLGSDLNRRPSRVSFVVLLMLRSESTVISLVGVERARRGIGRFLAIRMR
jgi:hypothetical protein